MSAASWTRLLALLFAAGFPARLHEKPFTEERRGRIENGISRSITVRDGERLVCIGDTWWRGLWTGCTVTLEGPDSLILRECGRLKNRTAIVESVTDFLAGVQA